MKLVAIAVFNWAQGALVEWLESPKGRAILVKVLRDLAARTETKLDDKAVELVVKGLENI